MSFTCLIFSHSSSTLRSGNTCTENKHPKMSENAKNLANASEQCDASVQIIVQTTTGSHLSLSRRGLGQTWNLLMSRSQTLFSYLTSGSKIFWRKPPQKHVLVFIAHKLDRETGASRASLDRMSFLRYFIANSWNGTCFSVEVSTLRRN